MKATEFLLFPSRLRTIGVLIAAFALSACQKDPAADAVSSGQTLRFEVSEGWHDVPQSRAAASAAQTSDVLILQSDGSADTLFLQVSVSDGIDGARFVQPESGTRAAPVTGSSFYDSFGVLASAYTGSWSETSCLPDYMYNVEVTKASSWTTSYRWPSGRTLGFFAYAPYNCEGVVLSGEDVPGSPTITYTVPDDVTKQKDLLVASKLGASASDGTADLSFKHALTAVKFKWGTLPSMQIKIKKITIHNVYGSAVYDSKLSETAGAWSNYGTKKNFSVSLDATNFDESSPYPSGTEDAAGTPITADEQTFMMIPQTLPYLARLSIEYDEYYDGQLIISGMSYDTWIDGTQWPMGKTVTYNIVRKLPAAYKMTVNYNQDLPVYPKEGARYTNVSLSIRVCMFSTPKRRTTTGNTYSYKKMRAVIIMRYHARTGSKISMPTTGLLLFHSAHLPVMLRRPIMKD